MPTRVDNYRKGYEAGKNQTLGSAAAEVMFAEMLRDDPGGHFKLGYQDAINNRAFNPPSIQAPKRLQTNGLIPKFSENPFGWFLGVLIVVELWLLWQLIKAPFQLLNSLMRSEKPSPSVIIRNVIVAGLAIALVWWVPHIYETRGSGIAGGVTPVTLPDLFSVSVTATLKSRTSWLLINGRRQSMLTDQDLNGRYGFVNFSRAIPEGLPMHFMCPQGYTWTDTKSETNSEIIAGGPGGDLTVLLVQGKTANLTVTCRKRQSQSAAAAEAPGPQSAAVSTSTSLNPEIQAVIHEWVSAIKSGDVAGQVALYDDTLTVYYSKQNLSKADVESQIASAYKTFSAFPSLNLSAVTWAPLGPGLIQVEFDKDFGAIRRKGGRYEGRVHSELILRQTNSGWRIAGEKDTKIYWTRRSP